MGGQFQRESDPSGSTSVFLVAVVGALAAVAGAAAGSLITGSFMLKAQRMQLEQAQLEVRANSSLAELGTLREIASEYFYHLSLLHSGVQENLEEEFDAFTRISARMLIWSPPSLAVATGKLNAAVARSLLQRMRKGGEHPSAEAREAIAVWIQAYQMEMASLRIDVSPGAVDVEDLILAVSGWLKSVESASQGPSETLADE